MIALGSDHVGKPLKDAVRAYLEKKGVVCRDYGWDGDESVPRDYPIYALRAANAVADGTCEKGLLFCGTGIGISIAANKVRGIRAGLAYNTVMARLTREHNNANVLSLGGRMQSLEDALDMAKVFLGTPFSEDPRHVRRIEMLDAYEARDH